MTANNNKSYLGSLNKLADEYNNSYHHSIGKINLTVLLCLKKIETNSKLPNLNLMIESELQITKIFLAKITPKISRKKSF